MNYSGKIKPSSAKTADSVMEQKTANIQRKAWNDLQEAWHTVPEDYLKYKKAWLR